MYAHLRRSIGMGASSIVDDSDALWCIPFAPVLPELTVCGWNGCGSWADTHIRESGITGHDKTDCVQQIASEQGEKNKQRKNTSEKQLEGTQNYPG